MKAFRWVLGSSLAAIVSWVSASSATVVAAIPLGDLVSMSEWVVVANVKSARSHYVTIGGSRRIVTETELDVEQALTANRLSAGVEPSTITVRTLGGTVDDVAQLALGEAQLPVGTRQLLFVDEGSDGTLRVAAMAQGQYPIVVDDKGEAHLQPSPGLDVIVHAEQSAVTALAGKSIVQAQALMQNIRRIP
jgi:hypothetical protein